MATTTAVSETPVYDLEVEDAHEFFANGVLVHNCTEAQAGADPDWTVGVLLGKHKDGSLWVLDVVRARLGPKAVRQLIKQTADSDGKAVRIAVEREGGSSGKMVAFDIVADVLQGYSAQAVTPKGGKAERAEPWASQIEAGNVRVVKNGVTKALLDEHRAFPSGSHDDIVDAASLAYSQVSRTGYIIRDGTEGKQGG